MAASNTNVGSKGVGGGTPRRSRCLFFTALILVAACKKDPSPAPVAVAPSPAPEVDAPAPGLTLESGDTVITLTPSGTATVTTGPKTESFAGPPFAGASSATSRDDILEQANLANYRVKTEAFNAHDVDLFESILADTVIWREAGIDEPLSKAAAVAAMQARWTASPDLQTVAERTWAAGPYVATVGALAGGMGDRYLEVVRFDGEQIAEAWVLYASPVKE